MTPEEILLDLRDIHMPDQAAEATGIGLVLWPLALVVLAFLLVGWIAWRRRSTWRREIAQCLDVIEEGAGSGKVLEAWAELAALLRRIAISLTARENVAGLIGDAWLSKLDHLFNTDIFSQGPGRGVSVYPYAPAIENREDVLRLSADELKATIDDVRKVLPHLKAAR